MGLNDEVVCVWGGGGLLVERVLNGVRVGLPSGVKRCRKEAAIGGFLRKSQNSYTFGLQWPGGRV